MHRKKTTLPFHLAGRTKGYEHIRLPRQGMAAMTRSKNVAAPAIELSAIRADRRSAMGPAQPDQPRPPETHLSALCNCHALRQATRRVTQLYDHILAPSGLRATQFILLIEIERLGPVSLLPLAKVMVMDRATLGHNLRPLEASGYLTLSVGADRRSREVTLTEAGREVLVEAKPLWRRAQKIFEGEFGSDDATGLRAMLHQIAATEFSTE
jgi:DNA-binding MarR family transcriptional regulator